MICYASGTIMLTAIQAFLLTHAKTLLTLGFAFGLISLAIKYADEKMSQQQKDTFNSKVKTLAPRFNGWRLGHLYGWVRTHRRQYLSCFMMIYSVPVIWLSWWSNADQPIFISRMVDALVPAIVFLMLVYGAFRATLSKSSASESTKHFWKGAVTIGLYMELCLVGSVVAGLVLYHFGSNPAGFGAYMNTFYRETSLWMFAMPLLIVLSYGLILFLPLLLLMMLRVPIIFATRGIWWLATYPKGPWAGLVFAVTMLLGIFRLFM
jgi:hypothetical protein